MRLVELHNLVPEPTLTSRGVGWNEGGQYFAGMERPHVDLQ